MNEISVGTSQTSLPEAEYLPVPELFAFLASFCLLVLELVAGRLLAPTIGVSLYTWTSIIGVVLGGVALGNWLGGKIADRHPTRGMVGLFFLLASVTSAPILLLVDHVAFFQLPAAAPVTLQILWVFGVLFFLPSAVIGAITPLLTRIAVRSVHSTGRVVGRIQAAASVGAIIGTFLTGFWLVSAIGSRLTVAAVAGLLLVLALAARPPWLRKAVPAGLVGLLAVGILAAAASSRGTCTLETNYACIEVHEFVDSTGHSTKLLKFDRIVQGFTDLDKPTRLMLEYQRHYATVLNGLYQPGDKVDAFIAGGGAYTFARYLELSYAGRILVAEIDPGVTRVARSDFALPAAEASRIEIVHDDARRVLRALSVGEQFDLIVGDAFSGFQIPYQLTTVEYAALLADRLRGDGIYVLNLTDGIDHAFLRSEIETLRQVFPFVALAEPDRGWPPDGKTAAFVIVAAKRPLTESLPVLPAAELDQFTQAGPVTILTDDLTPVEQLLAKVYGQDLRLARR